MVWSQIVRSQGHGIQTDHEISGLWETNGNKSLSISLFIKYKQKNTANISKQTWFDKVVLRNLSPMLHSFTHIRSAQPHCGILKLADTISDMHQLQQDPAWSSVSSPKPYINPILRFKHQVTIALSESFSRWRCGYYMGHQDRSKSRNCGTRRYPTVQSRPTGSCCSHWCHHLGLVGGPGHPKKTAGWGPQLAQQTHLAKRKIEAPNYGILSHQKWWFHHKDAQECDG